MKRFTSPIKTLKQTQRQWLQKQTCVNKITQLIEIVARDTRPAAVGEGAGLKRLLNYLEPGYRVP